jgi:hypothetical protein
MFVILHETRSQSSEERLSLRGLRRFQIVDLKSTRNQLGGTEPTLCAARGTSVRQIRVPQQEREEPFVWQTVTRLFATDAYCPANGVRGSLRGIHT